MMSELMFSHHWQSFHQLETRLRFFAERKMSLDLYRKVQDGTGTTASWQGKSRCSHQSHQPCLYDVFFFDSSRVPSNFVIGSKGQ